MSAMKTRRANPQPLDAAQIDDALLKVLAFLPTRSFPSLVTDGFWQRLSDANMMRIAVLLAQKSYDEGGCVDLNNDGKKDLVLGNKGTNTSYKPSQNNPLKLFTNDFDNNGTIEQIATRSINGKDLPINLKQELAKQIPSIKKKNLSYAAYATKTFQDLFSKEIVENSIQKTVAYQESCVAINTGNGKFVVTALPAQVQFSSVNTIAVMDVNNDGYLDLVLGGNQYEFKPQYGRLDANYGSVLLGSKKGTFTNSSSTASGFFVRGEIKKIQLIKNKNKKTFLLAAINNDVPKLFKFNE